MNRLKLRILKMFNKIMYPNFDIDNTTIPQITIFKIGILQKIIGFNRKVPWPVHPTSYISAPEKISYNDRAPGLSRYCHIDGRNGIIFGKNVWIGPQVKIISMNHDVNDYSQYVKEEPIEIGDNCWIGASAIILPGVKLGNHTIVAAGAVVSKSFPEGDQILAGVPAKIIKKLSPYKGKQKDV
jgi:acetyltransferase-like isoleucine patch superfamily enzyme